jgi:hypothetical protein
VLVDDDRKGECESLPGAAADLLGGEEGLVDAVLLERDPRGDAVGERDGPTGDGQRERGAQPPGVLAAAGAERRPAQGGGAVAQQMLGGRAGVADGAAAVDQRDQLVRVVDQRAISDT